MSSPPSVAGQPVRPGATCASRGDGCWSPTTSPASRKARRREPGPSRLAALEGLPEGERVVLELIAVDQLTVTEAAAALGIRQVTARVRLHRARKALRAQAGPPTEDKHGTALSYVIEGTGGEA